MTHRLLFALLLLAGCPGPDTNDPIALIGTWRQLPSQARGDVPVAQRDVLTVTSDTFTIAHSNGTSEIAHYTADHDQLSLSGTDGAGATFSKSGPYVVTGDRLLVPALLPAGRIDGAVGSWHTELVENAEHITIDLVLRADNTAHYDRESTTQAAQIFEGTWTPVVDDIKFTFNVHDSLGNPTTAILFQKQLPGRALGDVLYERL